MKLNFLKEEFKEDYNEIDKELNGKKFEKRIIRESKEEKERKKRREEWRKVEKINRKKFKNHR